MENKKIFRTNAKNIRNNLDIGSISDKVTKNILLWDEYKRAKNIMLFYPINSEISLLNLLNDDTKSFFFPSVDCDDIYPVEYSFENGFKTGNFNVNEPVGEYLNDYSSIDLIFVPALAVNLEGFRLGYGKGFYDRFLEHIKSDVIKAVPVPSKLVFDTIPTEAHDKKVQFVITENGVLSTLHSSSNSLVDPHP